MRKKADETNVDKLREDSLQEMLEQAHPPLSQEELDSMDQWPEDDRE